MDEHGDATTEVPGQDPWKEVGDGVAGLGRRLQAHYARRTAEEPGSGPDPAIERVRKALDGVFDALGDAVNDPGFREQARSTGASFADALTRTLDGVREQLSRRLDTPRGEAAWGTPSRGPDTPELAPADEGPQGEAPGGAVPQDQAPQATDEQASGLGAEAGADGLAKDVDPGELPEA